MQRERWERPSMKPWIVMDADAEMERELKTVREQMVGATREQVATTRQLQADCPRWAGEGLPVPRLTNSWRNWRPSDGTPSDELAFWCLQSVGWNYEDALAALPRTSAPYVTLDTAHVEQAAKHAEALAVPSESPTTANSGSSLPTIEGLKTLMLSLKLEEKLPAATKWCRDNGAESVEDLMEEDYADQLTKALQLPQIKSTRLIKSIKSWKSSQVVVPAAAHAPAAGARPKRWGDGLEAPAAGTRHFVPPGFEVTRDVAQSIAMFGHSPAHVAGIVEAGRSKAATAPFSLAAAYAAALYAYTEETPLYATLNYTMRTPHTQKTPTDTQLEFFADYIVHSERALNCLPTHVSETDGAIYRGIKVLLDKRLYSPGKRFTWQSFSSATAKQVATLEFVQVLSGRKLSGSIFVIHSITAKDIRHFSAFPSEEEVLFPPNSQFKVDRVVTSVPEKAALLSELSAYDLTDLDVYVIMQVA
eukprot:Tamp_03508.p1 GENE.Tamp_03508~~Tamp_03508.p1  ORF type:complete len:475 (-),score=55.85 Tamp_03508:902-2326(-)